MYGEANMLTGAGLPREEQWILDLYGGWKKFMRYFQLDPDNPDHEEEAKFHLRFHADHRRQERAEAAKKADEAGTGAAGPGGAGAGQAGSEQNGAEGR